MSAQPDSLDTQVSEWPQEGEAAAAAMALTTAPTVSLDAFAATQVVSSPPPSPNPEPTSTPSATPSESSPEKSLEAPASTKQPAKKPDVILTDSAMMEARTNYAEHHGLTIEQVSEDMVKGHEKGPIHWATLKTNVSARSATGQAMQRAMKHRPDVRELYQVLLDSEKIAFRRCTTNTYRRRKEDVAGFKTELQLQQLLGGCDKPEAVAQTANYVNMCLRPDLKAGSRCDTLW
eukprot:s5281_g7.t1